MRRVLAMLATTALLLAGGCGGKSYDIRLDKTLERMKYEKRLNDNLIAAPKGKFETLLIFIRPPKNLAGPTKEFQLTALEPGKFDLTESFLEKDKQNLHVLARVKQPKDAAKKKAAAKAEAASPAASSSADVVAILNSVYGVELDLAKAKEDTKKEINVFKHLTFEGNGKIVQLYLNVVKNAPYEVALIFEYPKTEQANLVSKIELCLESFATGEQAPQGVRGRRRPRKKAEAGRRDRGRLTDAIRAGRRDLRATECGPVQGRSHRLAGGRFARRRTGPSIRLSICRSDR